MRHCWLLVVFAGLFLMGCQESPPRPKRGGTEEVGAKDKTGLNDAKLDDAGGEVRVDGLTLTAPKGWPRKTPQSTLVQAEFVLPRAEGDALDGRLTLGVVGGSVEANIDRWKDQFGGKPEKANQEKIDVNRISPPRNGTIDQRR